MSNERKKCILLVRVSTLKQDFDEQEKELYQLAINDGYSDENIIAICEKESGIKLSEEDRHGLNRMKDEISKGDISCVYAWEISRIARKKKIIFSIVDYLVANGIQLVVKEPYLKLLNPDGSINDGAETILTLFSQLAESEMRNKQARWKRTRIANSKAGIWNGGSSVRYGYTIDENNRFIIDEEQTSIVKLVYELYTSTLLGQTHLQKELAKRGINLSQDRIRRILSFEGYTGVVVNSPYYEKKDGKFVKKSGHDLQYPAIISRDVFLKAQKKKEAANNEAHKGKNYYFARGIMKCPVCGHSYMGYKHSALYICVAYKHDNKDIEKCHNNVSININVLDTLLWDAASSEYISERAKNSADSKAEYKKQIKACQEIADATDNKISKAKMKKKRLALIFADGDLDEEEYQIRKSAVDNEISEILKDKVAAEERIGQLTRLLNNTEETSFVDILRDIAEDTFSMSDLREMCEIVHRYISKVELSENSLKGKRTKYVKITAISGEIYEYLSWYSCGGNHEHLLYRKIESVVSAFDEWRRIQPEITIKRRLGRTCTKDKSTPEISIIRNKGNYYI